MPPRPLTLLLLAAAAAAAAPAPSDGGFDALAGLLAKIQRNIETTHGITQAKFDKDQAQCNATLAPVAAELAQREQALADAQARLDNATREEHALTDSLGPLNARLAAAQLEMGKLAKRVADGEQDRKEEAHIALVKAQDTEEVAAVVRELAEKLAQVNVTQFSFRAVLERAGERVQDKALGGLLASAADAAGKGGKTLVRAGDEATVVRLRTLLSLLATELEHYDEAVKAHEKEAIAGWAEHRAHLAKRVDALYAEVKAATEAKEHVQKRVAEEKAKQAEERATLSGHLVEERKVWEQRRDVIVAHCDLKRRHFEAEEQAREGQSQTLAALAKLTVAHADSGYNLGIGGVPVPKASACCLKCSGDKPRACGDVCVPADQHSEATCGFGCACAEDDPRLAAEKHQ